MHRQKEAFIVQSSAEAAYKRGSMVIFHDIDVLASSACSFRAKGALPAGSTVTTVTFLFIRPLSLSSYFPRVLSRLKFSFEIYVFEGAFTAYLRPQKRTRSFRFCSKQIIVMRCRGIPNIGRIFHFNGMN